MKILLDVTHLYLAYITNFANLIKIKQNGPQTTKASESTFYPFCYKPPKRF